MRHLSFIVILLFFCKLTFGQTADSVDIDIKSIRYEPVTKNNYKDFPKAKLIVDYYYTNGISYGDRFSYEIILIDSLLMFGFSSPETDSYNYISYQKKQLLTPEQVNKVKSILVVAGLKQTKRGIPQPDASAHEKDVLIVKYKNINIAGGRFNHVIFPDSASAAQNNKEIALERKLTLSVGGKYELVIKALKKHFLDLPKLLEQVHKSD
jgi:hypothetical protein